MRMFHVSSQYYAIFKSYCCFVILNGHIYALCDNIISNNDRSPMALTLSCASPSKDVAASRGLKIALDFSDDGFTDDDSGWCNVFMSSFIS